MTVLPTDFKGKDIHDNRLAVVTVCHILEIPCNVKLSTVWLIVTDASHDEFVALVNQEIDSQD